MGHILYKGSSVNGLYPLTSSLPIAQGKLTAQVGVKVSTSVWHNQLGHPCFSILHNVLQQSVIDFTKFTIGVFSHCLNREMTKLSFPLFSSVSQKSLELVHSDV